MKIRLGFVTNCSTSSFIAQVDQVRDHYGEYYIDAITRMLLEQNIENNPEWLYLKKLERALKKSSTIRNDVLIDFPSCNYDTKIFQWHDSIYVNTCNNTEWSIPEFDHGDEDFNRESEELLVGEFIRLNVRNYLLLTEKGFLRIMNKEFYSSEHGSCRTYDAGVVEDNTRFCLGCKSILSGEFSTIMYQKITCKCSKTLLDRYYLTKSGYCLCPECLGLLNIKQNPVGYGPLSAIMGVK